MLLTVARARSRFMLEFAPFLEPEQTHGKHQIGPQAGTPGRRAARSQHEPAHRRAQRDQGREESDRRGRQEGRERRAGEVPGDDRPRRRQRRPAPQRRRAPEEPPRPRYQGDVLICIPRSQHPGKFGPVRVAPVARLQFVFLRKAEQEAVGHGLEFLEPHVHHHAAHARRSHRMNIRGVLHAVIAAERGHHAAQALGPVARPERLSVQRYPLNDVLDDGVGGGALGHAELYCPGMAKPLSRILVIEDEPIPLRELVKGLNAAARSLDNPLGITFSGVATAREALAAIETDGDIQAVLADDKLYSLADAKRNGGRKKLQMSALELVQRITRFRPELDVYILIAQESEDDVVDALFTEAVDGYFYREERDYRGIYRILNAQIQEKARTPFTDQLKTYVWMAKDQWHTPGHSSGESLRGSPWVNDFYEFMGDHVFDADLSVSVPMLDSLMEPRGVIAEAQQMAAKAFGARRTFFATNGTSTANKVIFQTLLAPGEKLLLDRNCHKSVHHGVVLS